MKKNIVFATCLQMPALQPSDAVAAAAFERRGCSVTAAAWNGDQVAFAEADVILIRSTWDWQEAPTAFAAWLDRLDDAPRVFNPPSMMRANMSKRYLLKLAEKGAPAPPARFAEPQPQAIAAAMDDMELDQAVVKPEFGGTGSGLSVVNREDKAGLAMAAEKMAMPGLVQALIPEIGSAGETSFMFIGGAFTHAVTKRPKSGEILCQAEHGGRTERADPPDWAVAHAAQILGMIPGDPLYARVDAVVLDGGLRLMEVELIEPELFFTYAPDAAARFADALIERL